MMMFCKDCNKPVEVHEVDEWMNGGDGREYLFNHEELCSECGGDNLVGIKTCACGNEMGEDMDFCIECYADLNQTLTDFMEEHKLSVDQLEDIISNHFGW